MILRVSVMHYNWENNQDAKFDHFGYVIAQPMELCTVPDGPNFTARKRLALLSHVDYQSRCTGSCERKHQTVVPLSYARQSLRALTLWLLSLPFGPSKRVKVVDRPRDVFGVLVALWCVWDWIYYWRSISRDAAAENIVWYHSTRSPGRRVYLIDSIPVRKSNRKWSE